MFVPSTKQKKKVILKKLDFPILAEHTLHTLTISLLSGKDLEFFWLKYLINILCGHYAILESVFNING